MVDAAAFLKLFLHVNEQTHSIHNNLNQLHLGRIGIKINTIPSQDLWYTYARELPAAVYDVLTQQFLYVYAKSQWICMRERSLVPRPLAWAWNKYSVCFGLVRLFSRSHSRKF